MAFKTIIVLFAAVVALMGGVDSAKPQRTCPAGTLQSGKSPICVCNSVGTRGRYNSQTKVWFNGATSSGCASVPCPVNTVSSGTTCVCDAAKGFTQGSVKWQTSAQKWISTCSLPTNCTTPGAPCLLPSGLQGTCNSTLSCVDLV